MSRRDSLDAWIVHLNTSDCVVVSRAAARRILPLATWTPCLVIFQSTSTSTEPQLKSLSLRLWLATTSVGQRSSSLGGSVTRTSPCAETLNNEAKRKWLLSPPRTLIIGYKNSPSLIFPSPCCFRTIPSNWPGNVQDVRTCERLWRSHRLRWCSLERTGLQSPRTWLPERRRRRLRN